MVSVCPLDSRTDTDEDDCIEESSSSDDDSSDSDDAPTEVVWGKAARGVWGMAHVFDGKLYFTRDHMKGNFIPKHLKHVLCIFRLVRNVYVCSKSSAQCMHSARTTPFNLH